MTRGGHDCFSVPLSSALGATKDLIIASCGLREALQWVSMSYCKVEMSWQKEENRQTIIGPSEMKRRTDIAKA